MLGHAHKVLVATALVLGACGSEDISSDEAEFANIWRANQVPKSPPEIMVRAFNSYCAPAAPRQETDTALRRVGYVPVPHDRSAEVTAYVIDDIRPAVAVSDRMCLVQAKARSGQTDRFQRYVSETFPKARALDPAPFGKSIEQAWLVPSTPPAIIATDRVIDIDWYVYSLIYFRGAQT